ncbi:hypothetical protein Tco_0904582 [Tanacetum coccineum]
MENCLYCFVVPREELPSACIVEKQFIPLVIFDIRQHIVLDLGLNMILRLRGSYQIDFWFMVYMFLTDLKVHFGDLLNSVMSYSDELTHSDGTTTTFPRYPDTLPYVYTRGHSTPRFSTLPPSLSFYPTSRRTACMFVILVIEPDLAERVRIAAFNLDDYQDDPESPPPSPLSPYLFAAYQKMIAEADLTKRERALITVPPYGTEVGESSVSAAATSLSHTLTSLDVFRSHLVIQLDLAKRARIAAFNLDDYQDDPESPLLSPLSPYLFSAYQKMIAEEDLIKREKGSNYCPTLRDKVIVVCLIWDTCVSTIEELHLHNMGVMSYSDELTHSDGTTTIFPRYPDTLPYMYTRGHSTPRFSTLPPSLLFYPTSRHTAHMSVIPVIEPDLAERARIAAFNLDDY